ncbi:MAG: DUF1684 domain-containing protein [Luteitalea sp.]
MRIHRIVLSVVVALSLVAAVVEAQVAETSTAEWRQQYETSLRAEYGWLSVAGLSFLEPGISTIGSLAGSDIRLPAGHAPLEVGRLVMGRDSVRLHLRAGVDALLNGAPAPPVITLRRAHRGAPGTAGTPADRVRVGKVEFHLHESGPRLALRVRDPQSPLRVGFQGASWFPDDPGAHTVATLHPSSPRTVTVTNILGDPEPYQSPGTLELTLNGAPVRLLAFTAAKGRLQVIFRDATVGRETYGTRFVYAEPIGNGRYRLDFNRAYNPPCAYNPYTTCPTPPAENVLAVPVRAGEKLYRGPASTASRR